MDGTAFKVIPEMVPELIVPDLTDCKVNRTKISPCKKKEYSVFLLFQLKPYVSYRVEDIVTPPMTPEELFGAVYVRKIAADFKSGKLGPNGEPLKPSAEERLTAEEAKEKALSIKSDIL